MPPAAPLRIRTTYEHSAASVKSDSPDPQAEDIERSYSRLEGQVIEFTLGTDGHVSDVHGLEGVIDDDQVRQAAEQWMAQVSGPAVAAAGVAARPNLEFRATRHFHAACRHDLAQQFQLLAKRVLPACRTHCVRCHPANSAP